MIYKKSSRVEPGRSKVNTSVTISGPSLSDPKFGKEVYINIMTSAIHTNALSIRIERMIDGID